MNLVPWKKAPVKGENSRPAAGASILVIDDEASIREWLLRGLPSRGFKTAAAANGSQALNIVKRQRVDLIVCDIKMPGQGGVSVLKDLKNVQPNAEVIMATGYGAVETAVESMKLGAFDYIAKPFSIDQLCSVLEAALAIQRSRRSVSRLQKNKSYLRWLWLLPFGFLLLWGINFTWKLEALPDPIILVPSVSRPQKRTAKSITPKQVPPLFLHPELIPSHVTIVQCNYKYPIIPPGGTLDFDIVGSGFSTEFRESLIVKSGTPDVWMHNLQWVTANQIHARMTATPTATTEYLRPYVFIHDQAVFQAGSPFAVIRSGEVLDVLLVNADETGRAGKFRIYANLDSAMEKQLRIVPSTPELVFSVPHSVSPYVWEGLIQLKKITPGDYGVKVYIGECEVYQNSRLIQVVKPDIGKTGVVHKLSASEPHRRPGDVVTLYLLGSGFVPEDTAAFKAHVNEWDMGNAVIKYISPSRLGFSFSVPPQAPKGTYGVTVDKNNQPFYLQSSLFTIVPSNWLELVEITPSLSPGHQSELRLKGRDFTPSFVHRLTINVVGEPGLRISGLHQVDADTLIAGIRANANVPPGDYLLHITAQGQAVKSETEHFMVRVVPR